MLISITVNFFFILFDFHIIQCVSSTDLDSVAYPVLYGITQPNRAKLSNKTFIFITSLKNQKSEPQRSCPKARTKWKQIIVGKPAPLPLPPIHPAAHNTHSRSHSNYSSHRHKLLCTLSPALLSRSLWHCKCHRMPRGWCDGARTKHRESNTKRESARERASLRERERDRESILASRD